MVLVDDSHRRRGFGTKMLDAVLDLGRARGVRRFGLDATHLGRPVYLRRGFADAIGIDRWLRPAAPRSTEEHVTPLPADRMDMDLDLRSCGVDRRRLLSHLAGEPAVRLIAGEGAYALLRPGRAADHVGPVIAANEARAEEALAGAVALLDSTRAAILDVPRGRLSTSLPAHGFKPVRQLVRMQTADVPASDAPLLAGPGVFAACGFEFG
jgi:hypothetical protein